MAQKMTGALVFDERTDRYDIRFDLNSYYGEKVRYRLCAEKGRDGKPAPLSGFLQGAGRGRTDRSL